MMEKPVIYHLKGSCRMGLLEASFYVITHQT
jgi:hypothetical protein